MLVKIYTDPNKIITSQLLFLLTFASPFAIPTITSTAPFEALGTIRIDDTSSAERITPTFHVKQLKQLRVV